VRQAFEGYFAARRLPTKADPRVSALSADRDTTPQIPGERKRLKNAKKAKRPPPWGANITLFKDACPAMEDGLVVLESILKI